MGWREKCVSSTAAKRWPARSFNVGEHATFDSLSNNSGRKLLEAKFPRGTMNGRVEKGHLLFIPIPKKPQLDALRATDPVC